MTTKAKTILIWDTEKSIFREFYLEKALQQQDNTKERYTRGLFIGIL